MIDRLAHFGVCVSWHPRQTTVRISDAAYKQSRHHVTNREARVRGCRKLYTIWVINGNPCLLLLLEGVFAETPFSSRSDFGPFSFVSLMQGVSSESA